MTNEIEHSGVVALGDVREAIYVEGKDGWRVTSIDILREWFGGERYANDYEYLDANYGKRAQQVVDWLAIAALARPAQEPVARVSDYRKSDGTTDFYVMIGKGESAISLHMHKIRRRAEYEAAEINHALTGSPKPEFEDFDLDTIPAAQEPDGITISQDEVKALIYGVPKFEFSQALTRLAAWLAERDDASPQPFHTTNCCKCGRIIDTREKKDGGDNFGAQLSDGRWTCSIECDDAVVDPRPVAVPDGWKWIIPAMQQRLSNATVREVAKQIGISSASVSRISRGSEPTIDHYFQIKDWLSSPPQPVINPTHSQVDGTPGLLTDPAPSDHARVWKPMCDAPTDGKHCILAIKTGAFVYSIQGAFMRGKWMNAADIDAEPLCWMPNFLIPDEFLPWKNAAASEGSTVDAKERKE